MTQPRRLLASLAGYRPGWLPADVLAALTLAAIAIPEQIATARLIGMPPAAGLVAFAAGTLGFALFGTSRLVSVGADSTIAPVAAAALAAVAATGGGAYAGFAGVLALMVGAILVMTGILRLGWLADLLSIPVTTGFLAGIAVHIVAGQLPALLGLPEAGGTLPARLAATLARLGEAQPAPLLVGLGALMVCLLGARIDRRLPGPMLALLLAALVAQGLGPGRLEMLDALPPVLPRPELLLPGWRDLAGLVPVALMLALLCMMQTSTVLQAFPTPGAGPGREFAAVGAGNLLAGLAGGFPVNASPPRTEIVAAAGGRSQASGLLAVALVAGVALAAGGALALVPRAALAGILVFVALRIVRLPLIAAIRAESPAELPLVLASAALVVLMPIEIGAGLAILLSVLLSLAAIVRPQSVELTRVPGTTVWWADDPRAPGEREPGVLVFALAAPVIFVTVGALVERLTAAVAAEAPPCRLVVIECSGVVDIDFTGARRLGEALAGLRARGIDVALARLEAGRARTAAARTGLAAALGPDRLFRSVEEAVDALRPPAAG